MKLILLMLLEGRLRAAGLAALVGPALGARRRFGGALARLVGVAGLVVGALVGGLALVGPAAADGHPSDLELVLSLADESDNVVAPGGEFTVEASLRFTQPSPERRLSTSASGSALRLSGYLAWEGPNWHRLDIAAQRVMGGGTALTALNPAGNFFGSASELVPRALDGRTLVARPGQANNVVIFDAWNKRQAAVFAPPAGANAGTFGQSNGQRRGGNAIAVWHDDGSDTAWLFIVSNGDRLYSINQPIGQLYVYELDWSVDPLGVTLAATLGPLENEVRNSLGPDSHYGFGVTISQDGSTLAVSAPAMNQMGAVYVYPRPDGPGEDWGDLEYADGIKVTPAAVPTWGTASTRPFNSGAPGTCNSYCSRVTSLTGPNGATRANFGWWGIDLSADGSVLAVGSPYKRYPFTTPGGQFTGGTAENGEAYVFVAPNGDWRTTPEVTGRLIPTGADARGFDPELHYSAGPMRRVTEPTAVLLGRSWASPGAQLLGWEMRISDDGSIVAASAHHSAANRVMIFQRDSAADWADAGDLLPSAELIIPGGAVADGGIALNGEGSLVLVGQRNFPPWPSTARIGRVLAYSRPADGQWAGTIAVADARAIQAPTPRNSGDFAFPVYDLDGERLAFAEAGEHIHASGQNTSGFIWLSDGGCTQRVVDGESVWNCPIELSNPTVTVPLGTEEGPFTITGNVTVTVDGVTDSAIELSSRLEAEVGTVRAVDSAALALATYPRTGESYPSLIERGETTRLRLQILNESGKAAETGSVSSVVVTTTVGGLSSLVSDGACTGSAGLLNCVIPVAALTTANSDELLLELSHTGKEGTASVWATVLGKQGERVVSNRVRVDVSGPAAALAIGQPSSALLGFDPSGATDLRNQVDLVVSATDEGGNRSSVPTVTPNEKLTGPDGKEIRLTDPPSAGQKFEVEWPLRDASGELVLSGGNPQARVTVLADRAAPAAAGEYMLELSTGTRSSKVASTQTFMVSGGAATVSVSVDPSGDVEEGSAITVTAMVTDASGAAVPDGTPVSFAEGQTSGAGVVLVLSGSSRQLTRGGQASVVMQAIGRGNAYVRADADAVGDVQTLRVVAPALTLEQLISSTAPGSTAIWLGAQPILVSQLYASLPGVDRVYKWDGYAWLHYGVSDGMLDSGSDDFPVTRGTVLWLSAE